MLDITGHHVCILNVGRLSLHFTPSSQSTLWIKWHIRATAKYLAINLPLCNLPPYTHHYTYLFAALKGNRLRVSLKDFIPAFPFFFPLFNPLYWKQKKKGSKSATEVFDSFLTDSFYSPRFSSPSHTFRWFWSLEFHFAKGELEKLNSCTISAEPNISLPRVYDVLIACLAGLFRQLSACFPRAQSARITCWIFFPKRNETDDAVF